MSDYLNILKKTELRPNKIKIKEDNEVVLLEQDGAKDLSDKIIEWFTANPYPKDDAVHAFAQELKIDEHEFEGHIYKLLSAILCEGRSKDFKGSYDAKQIKMGMKVEMEHTTVPKVAEKISKDHLAEIADYYTRLAKMESEAGITKH